MKINSSDWLARLAEIATAVGQAVQTAISNAGQMNDKVWLRSKALGNLQRSKENLRDTLSVRKTTGFMTAACGSAFWPVIERVEDQDNVITNEALDRQFGPIDAEPVEDVQEESEQAHVALLALTECESFDIVLGAAPSGLEALRRLVRRWDPLSGGKHRALVRQILVPDRCKPQALSPSPFVDLVSRESPVGEHAMNGVAESAMREVKRQTRTLKFALEAHVAKIVESHSILKWIPTMAADAISFFRIGRDGLTAEMRRSGRAWKKLVAEFGESVHYRPAVARAVGSGVQPKLYVGRYLGGHHARNGSILIMTTDRVVKAVGFRRMNEESRWNVDNWNAVRGLPWDVTETEAEAAGAIQAPRVDATSALRHKGRLEEIRCDDRLLSVF